jgi:VCBS repeat-containing protein
MANAALNLSDLNGSNGFVINGINAGDGSGTSVSNAGDINGDGIDDLIIGTRNASPNGQFSVGSSYVVFGSSSGLSASLDLSSLNGSNGFVINGINAGDFLGTSVSSAGDINGDGIDDLIIGASGADPNGQSLAGSSYVVFGSSSGLSASLDLSSLNGSNGFVINGINAGDCLGTSVSSAGDINGDGIDDLIIGARYASPNGQSSAGSSYVVFGRSSGLSASLDLSSLDGSNGFVINGINRYDYSGSVSNAGDINGDGIDDLIIGTRNASPNGQVGAGSSYVVFGRSSGFGAGLNLSSLDGSEGFVINGINRYDFSGSVSNAGDINGDGFDDLIIGASGADPNGQESAGSSYVVFGFASPTPTNKPPVAVNDTATTDEDTAVNISVLVNDSNFLRVTAIDGRTVVVGTTITLSSGALVTLNADGNLTYDPNAQFEALAVGESGTDSFTYTINNGSLTNTASVNLTINGVNDAPNVISVFNLSSLDGSNGFVINGINERDYSGTSVSSAGDINGDGIDDLIIGASGADPNGQNYAGSSYVVFGSSSGFGASLDLSSLDGSNGFVINGINERDRSGTSVSSAGDINGDGIDDLIIGARNADPNGQNYAGSSYVVFGFATAATTNEDTAVNILAQNILGGYRDAEGGTLTITDFTNPTNGTLTLNDNSTLDNPSDDFFIYTPNTNFNGTDTFNFTLSDGNGGSIDGTFNLNVKPVNDAPIAVNDSLTTALNIPLNIPVTNLLANDTDIDSSNLRITKVSGFNNGIAVLSNNGTPDKLADDFIVFTPLNGFSGNASFNYTLRDGSLSDTAKVTVAVGAKITGTNQNDTISGTPGDDSIRGRNGNDTIFGGQGKDTISGDAGNDKISGDGGNDILTGGNGNDTIFGGIGKDILTGGNGKDKFIFASEEGTDTITDFSKGTDLIGLSGGLSFGQLSFSGNNILITSTHEILATLTGINTTTLTSSNFTIV